MGCINWKDISLLIFHIGKNRLLAMRRLNFKILSPIFTSTFSILNRRLLDLDDEWKNIRLKNAEDSTEKLFKQISEGLRRLTTEVFSKSKKTSQEEDLDPENITQKGFQTMPVWWSHWPIRIRLRSNKPIGRRIENVIMKTKLRLNARTNLMMIKHLVMARLKNREQASNDQVLKKVHLGSRKR